MTVATRRSALAMYSLEPIRPAVEALWAAVRSRLDWLSAPLEWDSDLHELWNSPDLEVSQTCGWPLVTTLAPAVQRGDVTVIGTFVYDVPEADGHTYRSVLVAMGPTEPASLGASRAAVNDLDSLSGWVSLRWGVLGGADPWPGDVVVTGSHLESLRAVVAGTADVASLDAVTWALLQRHHPDLTESVTVVGHGPRVPCLPLIAGPAAIPDAGARGAARLAELRAAFAAAVAEPALATVRSALAIRDFAALDRSEYEVLRSLA